MKKLIVPLLLGLTLTGIAEDDLTHYTTVGNLAMTVTNFGVIGHGYNIQGQPSCVYKYHTTLEFEEVEHFSYGGLWLGGVVNDSLRVTTGVIDGNLNVARGWEWNPTPEPMLTRSSIITSPSYSPSAVSHQDFLCSYTDTALYNAQGELIEDHNPLRVKVNLRSYAWNYSFADAFVILEHQIINLDTENSIDSLYAGYWVDEAVGNFNLHDYYAPGHGGWYWYDNMVGAVTVATTETDATRMPIGYDYDGDDGYSESFIGVRFLGADGDHVNQDSVRTSFGTWEWNNHGANFHPNLVMPINDAERFLCLQETEDIYADEFPYDESEDASWMLLSGAGCFGSLPPGDTLTVVLAVVAGRWAPVSDINAAPWEVLQERAQNVILNSDWAQIAYNGEDADGDHILDPGEDLNGNGVIDRYLLPEPPPAPHLHAEVGNNEVTLYWDDLPESFIDPIQAEEDFEGYRVYASPRNPESGSDKTLLAQFDLVNHIPPNTGLADAQLAEPVTFDGIEYHYSYTVDNLVNGMPYGNWFAVSSYDQGNPDNNLPSLESAYSENWVFAYPGTVPTTTVKPSVVPNPYRAQAGWDGYGSAYNRLVWFINLPAHCEIRIFTLSGDLVEVLPHNAATYQGDDYLRIELLQQQYQRESVTPPDFVFSGGAHAWDLVTRYDQELATGLYLFTVENMDSGDVDIGKFMVIK